MSPASTLGSGAGDRFQGAIVLVSFEAGEEGFEFGEGYARL